MIGVNRGAVFQQIDRLYRDGTLAGLRDGQLLERYLSHGDEAAFEALISVHGPMVLGVCRRVLREPQDIEDAFQATFLILVRKAPTIRDRGLLSNWLHGVASRVARRVRAQTLRRRNREIGVENLEAQAIPETSESLETGSVLDQELNRLPKKYRVPLILCYLNGRTHDQAAEEIACPVGTVRSRLARGRDLLRRRLTNGGHAPTAAILCSETALPATLVGEAVPLSLVSSTAKAALQLSASKTIQAGAVSAPALALTHGVLTTMKFTQQLKFIGIALLATSVPAGSMFAYSYATGQNTTGGDVQAVAGNPDSPQETITEGPNGTTLAQPAGVYERLSELEKKLDELLRRSNASVPLADAKTAKSRAATNGRPDSIPREEDARRPADLQRRSVNEHAALLKLAIANSQRDERLYKQAAISQQEWERSRGQVLVEMAILEGYEEEMIEECCSVSRPPFSLTSTKRQRVSLLNRSRTHTPWRFMRARISTPPVAQANRYFLGDRASCRQRLPGTVINPSATFARASVGLTWKIAKG